MKNKMRILFSDTKMFGNLMASTKLTQLSIKMVESEDGPMSGMLVIEDKEKFNSLEEAYVALFKKYLCNCEEWNEEEVDMTGEDWAKYLEKLPRIYQTSIFKDLHIKELDPEKFINKFRYDFCGAGMNNEDIEEWIKKFDNVKVVQIKRGHVYYQVFGVANEIYFLFEWGIYA